MDVFGVSVSLRGQTSHEVKSEFFEGASAKPFKLRSSARFLKWISRTRVRLTPHFLQVCFKSSSKE